jgi:hypothetical protein
LLAISNCRAVKVLKGLGKDIALIRQKLEKLTRLGKIGNLSGFLYTPRARRILVLAVQEVSPDAGANTGDRAGVAA